ncbi:hypothetical protein IU468_01000 [Nocardia farcinica]|uniref:hypothetical protein n=1 Tax=Nocardia TaxID=1817 RepID=UPI000BF21028|nr:MULTISPECIES: hypothetical protein [Nocardia]MBF6186882.1 hypothetical protein [Nocardia farcinica]MBF6254886.1 hypothetical protein [Nocardia farcinica]MBF6406904.1 hypothetical protein [Nocardia farcinica]PEH78023.1 hypothetical protein CRM89_20290 [Nocardia sp. FDAARGOS_372]
MKRFSVVVLTVATMAAALAGCGGSDSDSGSAAASSTAASSTTGEAAQTTCAEFKNLDTEAEKAVVEAILAENPDSPYAGSPNVALGTAKLVCLSEANAGKTVAAAAGLLAAGK